MESSLNHENINWEEDVRQEEISKEKEQEIDVYLNDFYNAFYSLSQDRYNDGYSDDITQTQFRLIKKLDKFLEKRGESDKLLDVIDKIYKDFIVYEQDILDEENQHDEIGGEDREGYRGEAAIINLQNFFSLYKLTGAVPPADLTEYNFDSIEGVREFFYCPEAKVFKEFLSDANSLDKNFEAFLLRLRTGDAEAEMVNFLLKGGDKTKIKQACNFILENYGNNYLSHNDFQYVALLKEVADIELSLDSQQVQEWYNQLISEWVGYGEIPNLKVTLSLTDNLNALRAISGIAPDFVPHTLSVQKMYDALLDMPAPDADFECVNALKTMSAVHSLTHIKPIYSSKTALMISRATSEVIGNRSSEFKMLDQIRYIFDNRAEIEEIQEEAVFNRLADPRYFWQTTNTVGQWFPFLKSFLGKDNDNGTRHDINEAELVAVFCDRVLLSLKYGNGFEERVAGASALIKRVEQVSGIKRNFSSAIIRRCFSKIIQNCLSNHSVNNDYAEHRFFQSLNVLKEFVGEKAVFETELIQEYHKKIIIDSFPNELNDGMRKSAWLQKVTGIVYSPDWTWTEEERRQLCKQIIYAPNVEKSVADAEPFIRWPIDFSLIKEAVAKRYVYDIEKGNFEMVDRLAIITGIPPCQEVITDLYKQAIVKFDSWSLKAADNASTKFSIEPDWAAVVRSVREILAVQPRDIVHISEFFANLSIDKRCQAKLRSAYEQDPLGFRVE